MVQKTSMSRSPYPPSQEIPMEVFDPSPQVRCGGRARGQGGRSRGPCGVGSRDSGEEGVMCPARRGEGRLRAPNPCGLMIDGRLARSWAAVWRSGEGAIGPPVTLASAPPRQGLCCLGTCSMG